MSRIDEILAEARSHLDRVSPEQADLLRARGALLVDIRPEVNRRTEGEIPGAIPIERIHLEWRLDPHGEHRIPGFTEATTIIVVCNEGYSSSLAARDLQRLGLPHATDLIGGYRAWYKSGRPTKKGGSPAVG